MTDTIVVNAYASLAAGVGAHFTIKVDGQTIGGAIVGTNQAAYSFSTSLAAGQAHDVQIVYDNDTVINGQDRNLFLQSIAIDGRTIAATDSHEVYHAAQPVGDIASSGTMLWNGTAEFALPASYFPTAAAPAEFYVSGSGSDSGDGSLAHPFATLQRAQVAMRASSTVHTTFVEGGRYTLSSPLSLSAADSGESFVGNPKQAAIIDGGNLVSNLLTLDGANNVTINGLSFANTATVTNTAAVFLHNSANDKFLSDTFSSDGNALLMQGSSGNTVSDNEFDNTAHTAIEVIDGSNGNVFDSNVINGAGGVGSNTGEGGFKLHGVNNNTISHNLVENTQGMGIGVENWDNTTINIGNVIEYNIVRNTNISSTDSGAIYELGRSHANTQSIIANNLIDGSGAAANNAVGIYLDDSTSGVNVYNNIVRGDGTHAVQIHGGDNNTVHNNIFDLGPNAVSAVLFQAAPANTNPTNTMANNQVTQNIIEAASASTSAYSYIQGGVPIISDNLYYNLSGAGLPTAPPTQDSNPIYGNPAFVNAAAGNYTLGPGSAAAQIGFQAINQSLYGLA